MTAKDQDSFELLPEGTKVHFEPPLTPNAERVLQSILRECAPHHGGEVQKLLWRGINGDAGMYLADSLIHPKTSEVLIDCFAEKYRGYPKDPVTR